MHAPRTDLQSDCLTRISARAGLSADGGSMFLGLKMVSLMICFGECVGVPTSTFSAVDASRLLAVRVTVCCVEYSVGKLTLPLRGGAGAASASGGHWTGSTKSPRARARRWSSCPTAPSRASRPTGRCQEPEVYFISSQRGRPQSRWRTSPRRSSTPPRRSPGHAPVGHLVRRCVPSDEYAERFKRALVTWLD